MKIETDLIYGDKEKGSFEIANKHLEYKIKINVALSTLQNNTQIELPLVTSLATKLKWVQSHSASQLGTLSEADTHHLSRYNVYNFTSTKVSRLKELKACTRCGYKSHVDKECTYK